VKALAMASDQKMTLFNLSKHVYYLDFNQILTKGKDGRSKIKISSYLPQKIDQNQYNYIECNPLNPHLMASLCSMQPIASSISN
jgi:hypothetical protein